MAGVLTTDSSVLCGPSAPSSHGGTVGTSSSDILQVEGSGVLVSTGVALMPVSGCQTPTATGTKPCTSVLSVATGQSTKLQMDGSPVMLDSLSGATDGSPPGTVPATAGQTLLSAE